MMTNLEKMISRHKEGKIDSVDYYFLYNQLFDEDVFYSFKNASGGPWSDNVTITTESGLQSWDGKIAVDNLGFVHVAWEDDSGYNGSGADVDVFYKYYNAQPHKGINSLYMLKH